MGEPPPTFGRFELRAPQRQLLRDGAPVTLGARAFDVLLALIERRDRVVSKAELLDLVWRGLVVEENNLQVQISGLRKLLGPKAITTVPGRGYRFTGMVDGLPVCAGAGAAPALRCDGAAALSNLPKELPPLYGRDADLRSLSQLLATHSLVTVVGAGGIGKSRLAQATAHALASRWVDGVWMVELAGLADRGLLPHAVAQVLDVVLPDESSALERLVNGLAQRRLLLVLDNCEHLLDEVGSLVQAVLQEAPHVTVLATSQEPLHLAAEQQYRVLPLAVPAAAAEQGARGFGAVALFEARVRAVDPGFEVDADGLAAVIDICRRLDGLPLAIELAAARVATLGLRPLRDKLDARFRLLTGGSRSALRRHQTLRAALEWSHGLLDEPERAVFRRLGVFAGGFTMEMAQAVAGDAVLDEWAVLDHLSALVDKSLVVAEPGDTPRYHLLESARAFALEQLAAAGETAVMLQRHAHAVRDFFERVDGDNLDGLLRTDQLDALLVPELDNLRAAHGWATGDGGDVTVAVVLAACVSALDDFALEFAGWLPPLQSVVEGGAVTPAVAARYWRAVASSNLVGRLPPALQLDAASRARTLYQALGQPRRVFSSVIQLARHHLAQHHDEAAQAATDEARALVQPDWPAMLRIRLLRSDGFLARRAGAFDEALPLYRDAVRVSASTGDWLLEVMARANLADLLWQIGPIEEAAREAAELAEELRERPTAYADMALLYANLIGILSEIGRLDEACAAARQGLPLMRRAQAYFVEEWAYLFWRRGQLDAAARLLGASRTAGGRAEMPLQDNEQRLIDQMRASLERQVDAATLKRGMAAGAALGKRELLALIDETLNADENLT